MQEILKRLELIKTAVSIDEEEIIELQVMKLKKLDIDSDIETILEKLESLDFSSALVDIQKILTQYSGVVEYVDPEIDALKLQLKALENRLQDLSIKKQEYLNDIDAFTMAYNLKLGSLIQEILRLKEQILYATIQENEEIYSDTRETIKDIKESIDAFEEILNEIDEDDENYDEIYSTYQELKEEVEHLEQKLEEDETYQEYQEAKQSYEEFNHQYEDIKEQYEDSFEISDDEKKELKKLWKHASKLCHPDIVADELKERATEIMQSLNEAYSKQDLQQVKKILLNLENGTSFVLSSETVDDKEILLSKVREYEDQISSLETEIEELLEDETLQTIQSIDDMDEYFANLKEALEEEKIRLENEINQLHSEKEIIEEWIKKLWQWADETSISFAKLPREKENLLKMTTIDFIGLKLQYIPVELCQLPNISTLILWDNDIEFLPKEIVNFKNLQKINLRGNPSLSLTRAQKNWVNTLQETATVYIDKFRDTAEITVEEFYKQNQIILDTAEDDANEDVEIEIENSEYGSTLYSISQPSFNRIRQVNVKLVDFENQEIHSQLDRGTKILDTKEQLSQYIVSYGKMHKAKLYSAFDKIVEDELEDENINVIDWGCGQALGATLLIDYIRDKDIETTIEHITLIEPSRIALSRGLLHVDVVKDDEFDVVAINKDIDSLRTAELKIQNSNINLHIFSNILDVEAFDLDRLCEKVSNSFNGTNYFICVSPHITQTRNNRLDKFFQYYENHYNARLLSKRESDIGEYKRYEVIFKVEI